MKHSPPTSQHGYMISALRKRLLRITTGLALIWFIAVWWGERGIFKSAVTQCAWNNWEQWTTQAQPHHVLLIADPQLVDPHTYPGRPWPLSSLTIVYTDLYLRRAYYHLQHALQPDSTLFLGDLFDGGREWGTAQYSSPEDRYKGYGPLFWLQEYRRFSNLFLRDWFKDRPVASPSAPYGRHLLASVPGNHDLGFASGINPQVKSRFDAYFGPTNRVDILGNHSFVSLDTVSLSAMDEVDPKTGAHGGGDSSAAATGSSHLWRPVEDFLAAAKTLRHRAVQREWRRLRGSATKRVYQPDVVPLKQSIQSVEVGSIAEIPSSQFPSVVLSHVPLFRAKDTPCGPQREGRPSISLSAGYQYQNVLTPLISSDIIKHLTSEEIVGIYSGDDHDYCEILHSEYTGAIKEITVKSMSWAMGIRKPGVQLLSLWNPVDLEKVQQEALNNPGKPQPSPKDTVQNQLCLLPDQLTIFIRYAQLLLLTLIILAIDTFRTSSKQPLDAGYTKDEPLLPLSNPPEHDSSPSKPRSRTSSIHPNGHAATGSTTIEPRKLSVYGNLPAASRSASPSKPASSSSTDPFAPAPHSHVATVESDDWGMPNFSSTTMRGRGPRRQSRLALFGRSVWRVAWPVLTLYLWFMWRDRAPP